VTARPSSRASRGREWRAFADVHGDGAQRRSGASRARAIPTPRRSRTSRASSACLVAGKSVGGVGGGWKSRHAPSGASARACLRRERSSEGPSLDAGRRRRTRGSNARAPTRVRRRAPRAIC